MNQARHELLREELDLLDKAAKYLRYSYVRCLKLASKTKLSPLELERFESLTGRFARLSDLLIQKLFRLIDQLDLEDSGTVRDRIHRAEKKGLIADGEIFIRIRELRNSIAHEYDPEAMQVIFSMVLSYCPTLFDAVDRTKNYASKFLTGGDPSETNTSTS
jgi:hypothetical protein